VALLLRSTKSCKVFFVEKSSDYKYFLMKVTNMVLLSSATRSASSVSVITNKLPTKLVEDYFFETTITRTSISYRALLKYRSMTVIYFWY